MQACCLQQRRESRIACQSRWRRQRKSSMMWLAMCSRKLELKLMRWIFGPFKKSCRCPLTDTKVTNIIAWWKAERRNPSLKALSEAAKDLCRHPFLYVALEMQNVTIHINCTLKMNYDKLLLWVQRYGYLKVYHMLPNWLHTIAVADWHCDGLLQLLCPHSQHGSDACQQVQDEDKCLDLQSVRHGLLLFPGLCRYGSPPAEGSPQYSGPHCKSREHHHQLLPGQWSEHARLQCPVQGWRCCSNCFQQVDPSASTTCYFLHSPTYTSW